MRGWLRPSGGLLYHWRARKNAGHWLPFQKEISDWLKEWDVPRHELVIIGPSAGYTLPSDWLGTFSKVTAYDLDPWAPWFFKKQHPQVAAQFRKVNVFWEHGHLSLMPIKNILKEHPRSPILFSNVLGQVLLEGEATEFEWSVYLQGLRAQLANHRWASYHDRLTHENGEVIDHLTGGAWLEGLPLTSLRWQLTPSSLHEIDAVKS